jgi:Cu/Ag efflux protein CusF
MSGRRVAGVAAACGLGLAACARKTPTPPPAAVVTVQDRKGAVAASEVVTASAVVEAIDQKSRMVTLKRADGERVRFGVSEDVTNLGQVKKGDEVTVAYYESVALQLRKPGEAPGVTVAEEAERARPGDLPAGAVAEVTTVTSKVVNVDRRKQTVTLELPNQRNVTVKVNDPTRLERIKVGDTVEATYREAIAVSVDRSTTP